MPATLPTLKATIINGWIYKDALKPIAETDAGGNVVSFFVYGTSALSPDYMEKDGFTYRFIRDVQGSVRLVVDSATGAIAQRLDYDSFGNVLTDTNPGFQPFGFQSGLYDGDTALVQFGARWYDAASGRWLSKDPILLEGGFNLYVFCGNDPLNYVDPWGLWQVTFGGGFGYAGRISFGKNQGRWNVSFGVGYGLGLMGSFSPEDSDPGYASHGHAANFGAEVSGEGKLAGLDLSGGLRGVTEGDACNNLETRIGGFGSVRIPGTLLNVGGSADAVARGELSLNRGPAEYLGDLQMLSAEIGLGGMVFGGVTAGFSWGEK